MDGSVCAFTTERGTADCLDPYSSFSCCSYTGDNPEHVEKCCRQLCKEIGIERTRLIVPRQVHGTKVVTVDACLSGKSEKERARLLDGVDALVTALPRTAIGVFTADCVPMLFYDAVSKVIGAAHAGWKGTIADVASKTLCQMQQLGATLPNMQVVFGPSICQSCFEVGDEVVSQFAAMGFPMEKIAMRHPRTGKAHIDLVTANSYWLLQNGIPEENIFNTGLCTKCHPERFFSARVLGVNSGRLLTGIMLR